MWELNFRKHVELESCIQLNSFQVSSSTSTEPILRVRGDTVRVMGYTVMEDTWKLKVKMIVEMISIEFNLQVLHYWPITNYSEWVKCSFVSEALPDKFFFIVSILFRTLSMLRWFAGSERRQMPSSYCEYESAFEYSVIAFDTSPMLL